MNILIRFKDKKINFIQVKSETIQLVGGDYSEAVSIDSTIGRSTIFSFSYSGTYAPYIDLVDPLGNLFCSDNHLKSGCNLITSGVVDEKYKSIKFEIPGVAEVILYYCNYLCTWFKIYD